MWQLTHADLLHLKGGGGEPFAEFVNRLIRAEAACGGLPQSEIRTQLRANIPDGGVDSEVMKALPTDKTGWFSVPTCWQHTAGDSKDLKEEINKPYAKKLVKEGYGYRLCVLGDLTPEKVQTWEFELKEEAQAINPQAPDPRVIHGGDLLPWAERFPALVAQLRNWTQGGFHWEAWQKNCRAVTCTFVRNPDQAWEAVRQQILQHANLAGPSIRGEACLRIGGAAGVGKTRLVFETLNELKEAPGLVLYLADENEARAAATAIATTPGQTALLVADECSPPTRHFLNENLRGHTDRIRLFCLDNAGERLASAAGQVWLKADALTNTEAILAANFSDFVPEDRRKQYARFTRGFVRFAADMCLHNSELEAGDMSTTLDSVERYVRNRLGSRLPVISAIALFHKVGFKDDVSRDLEALCSLTGLSKQQFSDAVREVRESPGFVVVAGRYWYVTPELVAPVLFAEGWQRWVANDLQHFFEGLPAHLLQQLLERVATYGTKEVQGQVGAFFRGWISRLTARDLSEPSVASLAAALIEASPAEYLPRLRTIIENAKPGELQGIEGFPLGADLGSRRTLVWLLERLVSFPEFFEDSEACLFRLAVEESEPQIGNNATAIWANLFSVYLSGTATPFDGRVPILRERANSPKIEEVRVAFKGLASALHQSNGHIVGEPIVSGRLRPEDWQPRGTVGDVRNCYRSALAICKEQLNAGLDTEHHRLAFAVIIGNLYYLLNQGLLEDLCRVLTPGNLAPDETRKLLQAIEDFLEHQGSATKDAAKVYIREVKNWCASFRPSDFSGRLREVCARSPWGRRLVMNPGKDDDEITEIAAAIIQRPAILASELDWLAGPEGPSAERLGFALGQADEAGDCGRMILEHAIANKAAPLLRGYVRGMVHAQWPPSAELLALTDRLESTHPEVAVDILVHAGDSFDALNRILRLVDSQKVSTRYLANLAMGVGGRELTAEEVNRLLPYFTNASTSSDGGIAMAGVRFLEVYLLHQHRHSAETCLLSSDIRALAWQLVEDVLPFLTGHMGYEWAEIVKKLAPFDPDRAARLLGQALLADDIGFREVPERQLMELAKIRPESAMAGFGSALLDPERGWRLQVAVHRGLIGQFPANVVLSWVRKHGLEGAQAIARHLPLPHVDESGEPIVPQLLDAILREYDDDRVFGNFLGGAHSGEVWWGNGGDRFRAGADFAKKLRHHPNRRIREYAENEISYRLHLAEWQDQEHEERFLPS